MIVLIDIISHFLLNIKQNPDEFFEQKRRIVPLCNVCLRNKIVCFI